MYQPYPSPGQTPEPARPPAPAPVVMAVRLMYAGAAVSALSLIVSLATIGSIDAVIRRAYPSYTASQIHAVKVSTIGAAVFLGLISIGLWVWMGLANRAGKMWARTLATVFFALDTVFLLLGFARPQTWSARGVALIIWLIGLGAIVLLYRPDSTAFFNASRGR
jgi:hypothetical protein